MFINLTALVIYPINPTARLRKSGYDSVRFRTTSAEYPNKSVCRRHRAGYYQTTASLPWLLLNYRLNGLISLSL